jgi:hypothetical protein
MTRNVLRPVALIGTVAAMLTVTITARSLDRNGGSDADRNDCTDALSCYFFNERRW